jgi:hypothetical protein
MLIQRGRPSKSRAIKAALDPVTGCDFRARLLSRALCGARAREGQAKPTAETAKGTNASRVDFPHPPAPPADGAPQKLLKINVNVTGGGDVWLSAMEFGAGVLRFG